MIYRLGVNGTFSTTTSAKKFANKNIILFLALLFCGMSSKFIRHWRMCGYKSRKSRNVYVVLKKQQSTPNNSRRLNNAALLVNKRSITVRTVTKTAHST